MDWTPYIVLSLVVITIGLQLFLRHQALQAKGKPSNPLENVLPELDTKTTGLVYCYSPSCGPCKTMLPIIDKLSIENNNIHKLDISRHTQLAREIGIRATPTTLLIENGKISRVILGAKSLNSLRRLMGQPS